MISDFAKLGYKIMGITQMKVEEVTEEQFKEMTDTTVRTFEKEMAHANITAVTGTDAKRNRAFITFYRNYLAHSEAMKLVKQIPFPEQETLSRSSSTWKVECNTEYSLCQR